MCIRDRRVYQRKTSATEKELRFIPNPLARLGKGEFWTQGLFLNRLQEELLSEDLLIAHYPNYLLKLLQIRKGAKPAVVGLSHGVTWDDRPGAWRSKIKRGLARKAFFQADAFVANDTFFLREMGLKAQPREQLYGEIAENRWFIPNCVPPDLRRGNEHTEIKALNALLVPRNLYRNRGVHLAVEAFALFGKKHPDTRLLIVGKESQPAYVEALKQRVKSLHLDDRVIFRGHVAHTEMAGYYASCECCLIPSLCGEGTSLAALEAMASGLATVSTNVAGLLDLPTVQADTSAEALAARMMEVYPERERIGRQQQETVNRDYSYEKWSKAWLEVIKRFESDYQVGRKDEEG